MACSTCIEGPCAARVQAADAANTACAEAANAAHTAAAWLTWSAPCRYSHGLMLRTFWAPTRRARSVVGPSLLLLTVTCGGGSAGGAGDAASASDGRAASSPGRTAAAAARKPSLAQRCAARCDRLRACGAGGIDSCQADCERDGAAAHAHERGDFLWRVIACLEDAACDPLLDGQAEPTCEEIARRMLTPSAALREFCARSAKRATECGQPAAEADCLDRFRSIDDDAVAAAIECLDDSCDEVPACFAKSFGF